ncbi:hypothetical protein SLNWT_2944 [Streptomyces albus]|uniref:Uncharacterized protein n=1 Tax=Streptomyces albus (strain ATCC 21838 / DSM 41398 / FERM P-419 / JCM 4703 / NBRC 107858) TaxID=1081613 RepID=A0A0B5EVU5_STRA4|nr:hypothetical protein SLNWT_2944 [Streptomyces albus]AOU77634.1 hypothetical protein SLNHY_2943 [Streptomyces albus]
MTQLPPDAGDSAELQLPYCRLPVTGRGRTWKAQGSPSSTPVSRTITERRSPAFHRPHRPHRLRHPSPFGRFHCFSRFGGRGHEDHARRAGAGGLSTAAQQRMRSRTDVDTRRGSYRLMQLACDPNHLLLWNLRGTVVRMQS